MRRVRVGLVFALGLVAVCASGRAAGDSTVVARVGDGDVTAADIRGALENLEPRERDALLQDPARLSQVVRAVLLQRVVYAEAMARQWDEQPAVAAHLERVRQGAIVESFLQSVAMPPASYPNEAELQQTYEANKAALIVPRQYRLAQIFIALPGDADAAMRDRAQAKLDSVLLSLREPAADFSAIARARSEEAQSAGEGGEIGWLTEARLQPEIRARVEKLGAGATTEPIRLDDGWHIVRVMEIKESHTPPLDEIRSRLAEQMRAERTQAVRQAYLARLQQQNPVSVNEVSLATVLKPAGRN